MEALPTTNTIRLETHGVVCATRRENVGIMQMQYRGNYPSAYGEVRPKLLGQKHKPLYACVDSKSPEISQLITGAAVGHVFKLGGPTPPFEDLEPRAEGRSPGFSGWVFCNSASQMKELGRKIRDDCVVDPTLDSEPGANTREMRLGDHISGTAVKGWTVTYMTAVQKGFGCCGCRLGGSSRGPVYINDAGEARDFIDVALEGQFGEYGTMFGVQFRLPDFEKGIAKNGHRIRGQTVALHPNFDPTGRGFGQDFLEEVALACVCFRTCRIGANTPAECILCRCPCYVQAMKDSGLVKPKRADCPPVPVVMNTRGRRD